MKLLAILYQGRRPSPDTPQLHKQKTFATGCLILLLGTLSLRADATNHAWGCNDFRSAKRNIYWASLTDRQGAGLKIVSDGSQHVRATVGPRAISINVLDYYGGSATGTPEWDGTYGNGKVIPAGASIEGEVRLQLLSPAGASKK